MNPIKYSKCSYFFLAVFSMISCKNKNQFSEIVVNESTLQTIDVTKPSSLTEAQFLESIENLRLIPLETKVESLVGNFPKVIPFKNKFYVFDKLFESVNIFDQNGKFLKSMFKKGSGPGECLSPDGLDVDIEKGEFLINSCQNRKVLRFDAYGNFLSENKINYFAFDFLYDDKSNSNFLFTNYNYLNPNLRPNVIVLDEKYKDKSFYFQFPDKIIKSYYLGGFTKNTSGILYNNAHSDTIFAYKEDNFYAKYKIKFHNKLMPYRYRKDLDIYEKNSRHYPFISYNFYENSQYLVFSYCDNKISNTIYYNTQTKQSIKSSELLNSIFGIIYAPVGVDFDNQNFVSFISYDILEFALKKDKDFLKRIATKNKNIAEILQKIKKEDNPVLVTYVFKSPSKK